MSKSTNLVLLIDDEPKIRRFLRAGFELHGGFTVQEAENAAEGLRTATFNAPDLIILDLALPDRRGSEVLELIRSWSNVPIIVLSVEANEEEKVRLLELGADDYVVKPFSVRELVMRVRALARRTSERRAARATTGSDRKLRWKGLELDPVRHRVFVEGAELQLRPLEFKLIQVLLEHPGRVFTRGQLLEDVWGISGEASSRTVDTHVRRLRERLDVYGEAVETVHGFGYRLKEL